MIRRISNVPIKLLAAVMICLTASISDAQTVSIQNGLGERGFGWMFHHNSLCYAILPRHVAGPFPRVTVTSEAPVATGTGTVDLPFWEGIDLAIAVVRGGIEDHCVQTLQDLGTEPLNRAAGRLDLVRLQAGGERVRDRLVITATNYLTFSAELDSAAASIGQGTSGAFAMVGEKPVGMAIAAPNDRSALFIRADEIRIHVERYLGQNAGSAPPSAPLNGGDDTLGQGFALILSSVDLPPVNPAFAPENMLAEGQYVFEFTATNRIVFEIEGAQPVGFRRLVVQSLPESGYAVPKEILVEFSPTGPGGRYFDAGRFTMGQDGLMDTGVMASRNARSIRLTLISAWSDGPVAVDRVVLQ